jgi:hypothetical protein
MLKRAIYFFERTIDIVKFAFMAGSSKHGNAALASVGSKWVVAKNLENI